MIGAIQGQDVGRGQRTGYGHGRTDQDVPFVESQELIKASPVLAKDRPGNAGNLHRAGNRRGRRPGRTSCATHKFLQRRNLELAPW